jgi:hypothetical protein
MLSLLVEPITDEVLDMSVAVPPDSVWPGMLLLPVELIADEALDMSVAVPPDSV